MDKSGLIVTNSHVISQSGDDIQIRFGANQVIEGKVIENDNNADIAIILVNLKNIKDYTVLKPFIPTINEPLVLIGEQILAVGSPIEWETLEKTLTSGVVGKYEGNLIYHDASINQGNSGGPLFNYDGDVVGVNTFIESAAGQAIGGSVSINKVMPIFERARQKLGLIPMPSENLLPDIPNTPYPIDRLLEQGIGGFPRRDSKDYMVDSKYFTVEFRTPPQGYKEFLEQEQELLKNRQKRAEHHGFEIKDDELHSKNLAKFYNYSKPVVTVIVKPKPQLTNGSKALNTLMLTAVLMSAVGSAYSGVPYSPTYTSYSNIRRYEKDFLKMTLMNRDNTKTYIPYLSARIPVENMEINNTYGYMTRSYNKLVDKTYAGVYEYNPKYFDLDKPLKMVIQAEGSAESNEIEIPENIKKTIIEDFKPYWNMEYLNTLDVNKKNLINKLGQEAVKTAISKINVNEFSGRKKINYYKKQNNLVKYYKLNIDNDKYIFVNDGDVEYRYNPKGQLIAVITSDKSPTYPKIKYSYAYPDGKLTAINVQLVEEERYILNLTGIITTLCSNNSCRSTDKIPSDYIITGPYKTYDEAKNSN
ncbi:MAG: hypothetical protein A2255_03945 [Candidatus Melainabacteria bacterium RIFOXYA2_FULL_32_9]|nr:MAG: hypothetical protein A2255_03945 [Candidatus Melainabacteria bacterium RIFOXYA2_FULL_32_9]